LKIVLIQVILALGKSGSIYGDGDVKILTQNPPQGFVETEFLQHYSDRPTLRTTTARRTIEIVSRPPESDIHEIMVQFRRKRLSGEHLLDCFPTRSVRTRMGFARDEKIQFNGTVGRRKHPGYAPLTMHDMRI
jgi:hypothetical protein